MISPRLLACHGTDGINLILSLEQMYLKIIFLHAGPFKVTAYFHTATPFGKCFTRQL